MQTLINNQQKCIRRLVPSIISPKFVNASLKPCSSVANGSPRKNLKSEKKHEKLEQTVETKKRQKQKKPPTKILEDDMHLRAWYMDGELVDTACLMRFPNLLANAMTNTIPENKKAFLQMHINSKMNNNCEDIQGLAISKLEIQCIGEIH